MEDKAMVRVVHNEEEEEEEEKKKKKKKMMKKKKKKKKKGGVTPEGWDVWVGNHDSFQMKASISNKDNCISRLCNDWGRAA